MEKEGKLIILFSFILLASLILFGFTQFFYGHPIKQYSIVITTSSTETKLRLFTWHRFNKTTDFMPIEFYEVEEIVGNRVGYDSLLVASENLIESFFNSLIKTANSKIPFGLNGISPIYFNLLIDDENDPNQFAKLLDSIGTHLGKSGFHYKRETSINMFSGKQKASYLWMATNYLVRYYNQTYDLKETVGVNHISNLTTSLSFAVSQQQKMLMDNQDDLVEINLFGTNYTLYSKEFQNIGFSISFQKLISNIVNSTDNKYTGCLPSGYKISEFGDVIYGLSDFSSCESQVHNLLNMTQLCSQSLNCTINDEYIPLPISKNFYSNNYEILEFLGLNGNSPVEENEGYLPLTNFTTLLSNTSSMCNLNLEEYSKTYKEGPQNWCFDSTLLLSIYSFGLRLNDSYNLVWASTLKRIPLIWEVGFFLDIGCNYFPWGNFVLVNVGDSVRISFLVIGLTLAVISAFILIFLVIRLVKKRKEYVNYQNIRVL